MLLMAIAVDIHLTNLMKTQDIYVGKYGIHLRILQRKKMLIVGIIMNQNVTF